MSAKMSIVPLTSRSPSDVKDRSVLKVVQLNNSTAASSNHPQQQQQHSKPQVSFKEPESDEISLYVPFTSRPTLASEITYQRLSRLGRMPSTTSVLTTSRNGSVDEKSTSTAFTNPQMSVSTSSSRSLSEPRRRSSHNDAGTSTPANHTQPNSNSLGQCSTSLMRLYRAVSSSPQGHTRLAAKWLNDADHTSIHRR